MSKATIEQNAGRDYAGAANRLLDREPPDGYRSEWARHVAEDKTAAEAEWRSCVVFRVNDSVLGLPASAIELIGEDSPFHTLPQRPGRMPVTLANVRGELMVCLSMEGLLGAAAAREAASVSRRVYPLVIVCRKRNERFAFPVDQIHGVEHYRPGELRPVPFTLSGWASNCTRGLLHLRSLTVALLDEALLFGALHRNL